MKLNKIAPVLFFTLILITTNCFVNISFAQTCHFTSTGKWDKSPSQAGYSCDVGYTPSTATTIYIDNGVVVTIEKQTSDIEWIADVIVEGTLILKTKLTLDEPSSCDLTMTVAIGGILTSSGGGGANELLIICGNVILSNSQGSGLFNWEDFPDGEVTGPQIINDVGGTLPVELTSFDAKSEKKLINLTWSTASEQNNDFFTLEKSKNGEDFTLLGTVAGNGTTNTLSNYSLTDYSPYLGLSYYRLSQTDYDGTTVVFPIISVLHTSTAAGFSISPNPVSSPSLKLKASGKGKNERLELNIIDLQGKLVERKFFKTDDFGNVETEFQLKNQLQKGTYIFELVSENTKDYLKVAGQ